LRSSTRGFQLRCAAHADLVLIGKQPVWWRLREVLRGSTRWSQLHRAADGDLVLMVSSRCGGGMMMWSLAASKHHALCLLPIRLRCPAPAPELHLHLLRPQIECCKLCHQLLPLHRLSRLSSRLHRRSSRRRRLCRHLRSLRLRSGLHRRRRSSLLCRRPRSPRLRRPGLLDGSSPPQKGKTGTRGLRAPQDRLAADRYRYGPVRSLCCDSAPLICDPRRS
jgi:hypothetical protein